MGYAEVYQSWKADPEGFWMQAAEGVDWFEKPSRALDDSNAPLYEWFTDGVTNTCWNAVDRHVDAGRGDQVAIIGQSEDGGSYDTVLSDGSTTNVDFEALGLDGLLNTLGIDIDLLTNTEGDSNGINLNFSVADDNGDKHSPSEQWK